MCLWNTDALGSNKVQITLGHCKVQEIINTDADYKGFICRVSMPNMKPLSLMIQELWSRLKLTQTDRHKQEKY